MVLLKRQDGLPLWSIGGKAPDEWPGREGSVDPLGTVTACAPLAALLAAAALATSSSASAFCGFYVSGADAKRRTTTRTTREVREGGGGRDLGVKVEAKFAVGEYEIAVLSAKNAAGLDTWRREEKYAIAAGAEPFLRPYVQSGMKFFVAKVDPTKVKFENGHAALSPIRFHYDAETFALPVRLGLINSSGTQDLIVNIVARNTRYEVANYPNVTIPTNIDVAESVRPRFGEFYASLFDKVLEKNPGAVVTEYAWDAGTCDPCPGPTLDGNDLATLGAAEEARLHRRCARRA